MLRQLKKEELYACCSLDDLPFQTTDDITPLSETIGQKRALKSLQFGLDIESHGFNIYILGESGTGKMTTIRTILEVKARNEAVPMDWCYVYNFRNVDIPRALSLPPGRGHEFRKDMEELISFLRQEIPKIFETKEYEKQRTKILEEFQERQKSYFTEIEKEAKEKDFALRKTVSGLVLLPVKTTGETLSEEEYESLDPKVKKKVAAIGRDLQEKLDDAIRNVREEEKKIKEMMKDLERQATLSVIGHRIDELRNTYKDSSEIPDHLERVKEDILENLDDFKPQEDQTPAIPFMKPARSEPSFTRYSVNVFVNNGDLKGAPVVIENNPTYYNLFGRVEHKLQYGVALTDFTMIKPGSLQQANGGYIVIDALELLKNIFSYDALKRTIKDREIKIEDVWEQYRLMSTATLKPQAVPFNVKIILVGNPRLYYLLYNLDEEYRELFKVKADYENRMDRTPENILKYASFVKTKCDERGLRPFDRDAVAKVIEYSSRLADHQQKLSAKFSDVADLLREADHWARDAKQDVVRGEDVARALEEREFRCNKVEKKILEATKEGTILIDTEGVVTGQINGLSVLDLGDYRFGTPSRITARTYAGRAGIVNIERETKMSGKIHEKAVLILTAYLGGKYAVKHSLSLTASLTFEQLYGGVEGDSATCAEVYALLSSISGVPLRQSYAVTGSMNQHGQVQPIGGVNEKIEGFFEACKLSGLNGKHGVIIPAKNLVHLMLKDEVIDAVVSGKFSIYAIDTIEDGIEILTGMKPGDMKADGSYPKGTFNHLVAGRLQELSEALKGEKDGNSNNGKRATRKASRKKKASGKKRM
ncbi:MAG: AAA family ATPase [Nitrospiraceae bacterium]|nr:MAG: AAA family ATPase [Nitrospiraceae bacterium]